MSLNLIFALIVVIPIVAFITGFVWYINLGGAWAARKKAGRSSREVARSRRLETEEV